MSDLVPAPLVHAAGPVTLAGGGPICADDLEACLALSDKLVAADGGANRLLELRQTPDAVIGDMDSLSADSAAMLQDVLYPVAEQDSTDFEKCLTRIAAPLVLAVGITEGRVDHALAAFNGLVRHFGRRCVIVSRREVITLTPPELTLALTAGDRVSLFPLQRVTGTSRGLHWPIDGIEFTPGGVVGTSNRADGAVSLAVDVPGMVLFLPRRSLGPLLEGLTRAPHWN